MMKQSKLHTLIREPLLHFLVIGAGLFFLFAQINDSDVEINNRITITQADLNRLATIWLKRSGRPPSAQEREQQLEYYIREQVLYREAMAMGLDQGDVIVSRRLAKKMEYLFNDLSVIPEPTETELALFLSTHTSKFIRPGTLSFSQIYLDPTQHKHEINKDAKQLLEQLKETTSEIDIINLGDRSLLPYEFHNERRSEITSMFGAEFANQVFTLPIISWQGPITSEYGVHLIYVHSHTKARLPLLAEIRERVASEWRSTKQHEANELFYKSLYQRYEIVLDDDVVKDSIVGAEQ